MLLLVTIVLVLIAAITLLIGIFGDNLALIFVSIGSSALAAIVLAVLSQASRRKARDEAAATATSTPPAPEVTPVPAARPAMPTPTPAAAPTPAVAPAAVATAVAVADLPIADYDSLRVNEILPSLEGLDLDQLEAVAQHEETTKNRATILDRIDELMDELEAAEAGGVAPVVAIPDERVADLEDEIEEEVEEAELVPEASASGGFPIDDYEALSEAEIIAAIGDLDADQLEEVAEHEETHSNRDRVLDAIDDRLDVLEGVVAAPASAPVAAVKKAATKKAAGKKAAVTKKAAATRKAAVAPPTRAAAAPKKAAVATKKAAAPVKRAAAVPKRAAAVKKAAPVKKAAAPAPKRAAAPAAKVAKAAKKAAKSAKKVR